MSIASLLPFILLLFMGFCAIKAVHATQLLAAALWLAGVSAATAGAFFVLGAYEIAVIELSLSLGLVTVLLAFAISMVGANSPDTMVRRIPDQLLVALMLVLLIALILPTTTNSTATSNTGDSFNAVLWETRQPDILVQMALVFAGVIGVLRLLRPDSEAAKPVKQAQTRTEADKEAVT